MMENKKVALISMPFELNTQASIQFPLLKAVLQGAGISTDILYFNVILSSMVGSDLYKRMAGVDYSQYMFMGYWSKEKKDKDEDDFLRSDVIPKELLEKFFEIKEKTVPKFLEMIQDYTDWSQYKVVCFSTTTNQLVPALAFSYILKQKYPHLKIILGGTLVSSEFGDELFKNNPHVDYLFKNEVEGIINEAIGAILDGKKISSENILSRDGESKDIKDREFSLDELPFADYSDLVSFIDKYLPEERYRLNIHLESSRGCPKYENDPCCFCGQAVLKRYKVKGFSRLKEEIKHYVKEYGCKSFCFNDLLFPSKYLHYIKKESDSFKGFNFAFYGILPGISKDMIKNLKDINTVSVQVGIESLNDNQLRLMNKKVNAIDCINILKWFKYYRIRIGYNLLTTLPGEKKEDYLDMIAKLKLIKHLDYPVGISPVYAPYYSKYRDDPDKYGIKSFKPSVLEDYFFPKSYDRRKFLNQCICFESNFNEEKDRLWQMIKEHKESVKEKKIVPTLNYSVENDKLLVKDNRNFDDADYSFPYKHLQIFLALDEPIHLSEIKKKNQDFSKSEVLQILEEFISKGLVIRDGRDYYLSLAIPR